jgi:hypothetical protein
MVVEWQGGVKSRLMGGLLGRLDRWTARRTIKVATLFQEVW